jgi:hypothetical protein
VRRCGAGPAAAAVRRSRPIHERLHGACLRQEQSSPRLLTSWRSNQHGVPACREQESLRFHVWRHSHSVPVRWRRGVAQAGVAQAVAQVERAAHPAPQAAQAAGAAVRPETALRNPPAAKAVRLAIALRNPPAARARTALTPQGRESGRGALVRTVKVKCRRPTASRHPCAHLTVLGIDRPDAFLVFLPRLNR